MTVIAFPARSTDPATSWRAARINQRYRNALRFRMLEYHGLQWALHGNLYLSRGLTDHEICTGMQLPLISPKGKPVCNWKRHSELYKDYGFCDVIIVGGRELERDGQHALVVNDRGLAHLDEVLLQYPYATIDQKSG